MKTKEYKIEMSNGYKRQDYCGGLTFNEAVDICEEYNWIWQDCDGVIWDLDIVEDI